HVTIGTAPCRWTLSSQSLRKRVSPLRHCWNQLTIAGLKPYVADQVPTAWAQTGRSGCEIPKYAPGTPVSSDSAGASPEDEQSLAPPRAPSGDAPASAATRPPPPRTAPRTARSIPGRALTALSGPARRNAITDAQRTATTDVPSARTAAYTMQPPSAANRQI